MLDALGKPRSLKLHTPERPGQVDRHIGTVEKLAERTGWRAHTSFAEGLERTAAWYRENETWWRAILQGEAEAAASRVGRAAEAVRFLTSDARDDPA